ncbi:MAG: MATE family efflux transporter, partial [Xanthobacteraceae bacterium]
MNRQTVMSVTSIAEAKSPAQAADAPPPRYDPRTRALIEGPIAATLIRLAAPNVLVMLAQTSVG